jgi:four helix bundle protein
MQDFKKLRVWQAAHRLTLDVYRATGSYPREELYGLMRQSRESSSSVPTNIAEGCGRGSKREFARFLRIAAGSSNELEYQLILGRDLEYLPPPDFIRLTGLLMEVRRMLTALIARVTGPNGGSQCNLGAD